MKELEMEINKKQQTQLVKNTLTELLETYNPKKCSRTFREITTVEKSISLKLPSIIKLKKTIGEEKMESFIKLWLIDLNNILDLRRPLRENQIDLISFYIVNDYGNLTLSDIHLIFTRAKTGFYGELYESLNMPKVLGWFRDYFEERLLTAGEMSRREHGNIKEVNNSSRKKREKPLKLSIEDYKEFAGMETDRTKRNKKDKNG